MATAANKRKQDEKHLKMLREIVSLPHNKQCFDCHQRGPTYVNMTVGAFVCTACSGILRGLNPPHRVKSISMATFTPEEMEFLRSRGNEFCRKVWLCRFNPSIHREPDSKDEQKVKDFMADKYEKKTFYTEGTDTMHEEARRMNTPPTKPDPKQLRSVIGNSLPALKVDQTKPAAVSIPLPVSQPVAPVTIPNPAPIQTPASHPHTVQKPAGFDLLGDLGGDPFAAPASVAPAPAPSTGFADFSNFRGSSSGNVVSQPRSTPSFPAGGLLKPLSSQQQQQQPATVAPSAARPSSVSELSAADKYAALASLDSAFGGGGSSAAVNWDSSFGGGWSGGITSTMYGSGNATTASNPFGAEPSQFGSPPRSTATTPGGNPFMGSGGFGQQAANFNQFPQQSNANSGFAQFPQSSVHASSAGFGMQNGFGNTAVSSQSGLGGSGYGSVNMPAQYATQTAMMSQAYGQFPQKMAQGPPSQQQFASWGQAQTSVSNPFMTAPTQQSVPPRMNSTNPFL